MLGAAAFLTLVETMSEGLVSAGMLYRHLPGGTTPDSTLPPEHLRRAHRSRGDQRGDLWTAVLRQVRTLVDDVGVGSSVVVFQHAAALVPLSLKEER